MNRWPALFCVLLFGIPLFAYEAEPERLDRAFDVSGRTRLMVKNQDGKTSVKAGSEKQVVVHVTKQIRGARTEREAKREMDRVKIVLEQSGNRVTVAAEYPKHLFQIHLGTEPRVLVHFDITAPVETDVSADVSDGPLEISGFDGNATLKSSDGKITADHLKGSINIQSSDGDIQADSLSGEMDVSSADGDVITEKCSGTMRLHTSDGDARLQAFNGNLEARTADGQLSVDGILNAVAVKSSDGSIKLNVAPESAMQADWNVRSSDGDVELHLPASFAADVDLHTSDGHIDTEVPISMMGSLSESHVSGKMNGGGRLLQIRTADGDIRINPSR